MPDDASGGTKRRRQLAVAGIAVVAASALAWALLARSPSLPRDRTVWFLGESSAGMLRRPLALCDAPDGAPCGYTVLHFDGRMRSSEVLAQAETDWLRALLGRLRLSRDSPEIVSLVALSSVTTPSGTWVECALDLAALDHDWNAADLTGVWIVERDASGLDLRVEFRPDGTIANTGRASTSRVGTWAEKRGDLYLQWDPSELGGPTFREFYGLSNDRRSFYLRDYHRWCGGRRE